MTWGDFDLHLCAEVNSDKKKEEAERQDACHIAYLLIFQFKATKPLRPSMYSSSAVSFRFVSFPSFPLVTLRYSSFDFGFVLPAPLRSDGLVSQSVLLARKAKEAAEEAVAEDTRN